MPSALSPSLPLTPTRVFVARPIYATDLMHSETETKVGVVDVNPSLFKVMHIISMIHRNLSTFFHFCNVLSCNFII